MKGERGKIEASESENEEEPPHLCKNNFIPASALGPIPGDDKLDRYVVVLWGLMAR